MKQIMENQKEAQRRKTTIFNLLPQNTDKNKMVKGVSDMQQIKLILNIASALTLDS